MIEDSLEPTKKHVKVTTFSFAVPDWKVELLTYLLNYKAMGGNISELTREALEAKMRDNEPPEWFRRWAAMVSMVQQQVEKEVAEDIKVDLGGLGYD